MGGKSIVAVIDDDESVRRSLARLITAGGIEARPFVSAGEFLQDLQPAEVSCVVSDLRMPEMSGLQLQEALRSTVPYLSIIFVTGLGDVAASVRAMKAGAVDFLEKPIEWSALREAIERAVERSNRLRAEADEIRELQLLYAGLTPREREVFALVSAGLLNKQVAAELGAAEKTIKQHRGSIMRKMGADSLSDLVLMAERLRVRPTGIDFAAAKGRLTRQPERKSFSLAAS